VALGLPARRILCTTAVIVVLCPDCRRQHRRQADHRRL